MVELKRTRLANFRRPLRGLVFLASVLLLACGDRSAYQPPPPPQVKVSQPVTRTVTEYLEFSGNTQAINTVQLRARVEGYLEKVLFNDGDRVKKGQLLFLIQQNTYQAKLRQAQGEVLNQKSRYQYGQTEFVRYSKLLEKKGASQTDVDQWRYNRDSAQAQLLTAEATRDLAQLDLEYTRVTAPFDGRIDRRLKDPGNLVGAGERTILAELNQIDPIYVYFTINERDLLRLVGETRLSPEQASKKQWPVEFALARDKGFPHQARLDFAAISVTPTTGTLLLRAIAPNKEGLILPGLFARVRLATGEKKASLLAPTPALGFDQQGTYVLVVNDQNVVERRAVTPGTEVDGFRVIETGLRGDEWVVTEGMLKAIPGRKVSPEREEAKAPGVQGSNADPGKKKAGP